MRTALRLVIFCALWAIVLGPFIGVVNAMQTFAIAALAWRVVALQLVVRMLLPDDTDALLDRL